MSDITMSDSDSENSDIFINKTCWNIIPDYIDSNKLLNYLKFLTTKLTYMKYYEYELENDKIDDLLLYSQNLIDKFSNFSIFLKSLKK